MLRTDWSRWAALGVMALVVSGQARDWGLTSWVLVTWLGVLLPWAAKIGRQSSLRPILVLGWAALIGSCFVETSGARLGLVLIVAALPAGLVAGSRLAQSPLQSLVGALVIAFIQWPLIFLQFVNPLNIANQLQIRAGDFTTTDQLASSVQELRPVGNTVSPGLVAVFLLLGIFLALQAARRYRFASLTLVVGHLAALVATGSRTAILSIGIAFALRAGVKNWRGALALAAGLVLTVRLGENSGRVDMSGRWDILVQAWPQIQTYWLTGIGWGETHNYVTTGLDGVIYHLHFLPAHVLLEGGICGVIGFCLLGSGLIRFSPVAACALVPFVVLDAGTFMAPRSAFALMLLTYLIGYNDRTLRRGEDTRPRLATSNEGTPASLGSGLLSLRRTDA